MHTHINPKAKPAEDAPAGRTCSEDLQSCFCRALEGRSGTWSSPARRKLVPRASTQRTTDFTAGVAMLLLKMQLVSFLIVGRHIKWWATACLWCDLKCHTKSLVMSFCLSAAATVSVRECVCVFKTERELGIKSRRQRVCPELNGLLQVDGSVINILDSSWASRARPGERHLHYIIEIPKRALMWIPL